ncbi:histidine phosphatase family protein [Ereboglobus luteus]|nr:histidine phosphatase family protein [Ereboglobus luteus]
MSVLPSRSASRVVLIRHTRVDVAPGVCYGRTDVPLASTFAGEATAALSLMPWPPSEIWTSPASRCTRLAEHFGISNIRVDPRLLELDFGEWENRAWESFRSPRSEAWALDPMRVRPPGGETGEELHARVGAARDEILSRIAADENGALRIAIITHAGVIRSWLAHASGRGLMDFFGETVPHGSPLAVA